MKTRQQSDYGKPHEWKDFIRDMDLWIMVYDALTFLAKQKMMGALALKAHVQNSEIAYKDLLNEREFSFFKEVLAVKTREFDPDSQLKCLIGQVVCVDLNADSHLVKKFGHSTICGKFLSLNKGKATTEMLSEDGTRYEQREAAFSFKLAYPDGEHTTDVSLIDLVNLELFL
jgi:hypothetical protein